MRPSDAKMSGRAKLIWILIIIGFACMEFPGVFFFQNMSEPYIFGFPFIYSWNLIMWAYLVVAIGFGYFSNWGEPKAAKKQAGGEAK
ncbi:MAG: hypothetical protein GX663_06770 [Clostridiales bacterium]|nr:hypothetical protein [Clostridiales bacterium]